MRLGIDLDGVVADFTKGWVSFYNRDFGADLELDVATEWNGLTELTHFETMRDFWRWSSDLDGRSLFWHLEPFPGAVEALHALDRAGHDVVIITAKPSFAIDDTHEWIEKVGLPATEVHITDDKWTVDCDVYLDDSPHVLPTLLANRPDRVVCRYVRPWNRPLPGAVDIRDFDEFRALVFRLESTRTK
ncbi:MAG: hypothetical protein WBZ45_09665 [Acidimicrobiia bacterium]